MAATVGLETWILITVDDGFLARSRSWSWTWLCNHLRAGAGVTLSRLSPFSAIYGSLDSFQTSFTRSLPRTMVRQITATPRTVNICLSFVFIMTMFDLMQGMINLLSHSNCQKEIMSLVCCLRKVVKVLQPQKMSFAIFSRSHGIQWVCVWPHVMTTRDRVGGRDTECLAWCRTGHCSHCTQGLQGDTHVISISILVFWSVFRGLPQV